MRAGMILAFVAVAIVMVGGVFGKSEADLEREAKAREWVADLALGDEAKERRVAEAIATHLIAVRDWHNEHPFDTVPAGINPRTGERLTELDRSIIADSAMPRSVHENLMGSLRSNLNEEQIEAVFDKYTIGKVPFTMRGYEAIVPDLMTEERETILGYLKEAREQAIDFKNMKQVSAIFEIYKTKSEQYLNSRGRNWRQLYSDYVRKAKEEKSKKQEK